MSPMQCCQIKTDIGNFTKIDRNETSHDGNMSSDNGQSMSSPRSSINLQPKIDHLDNEAQRKLRNNLDDILLQQGRSTGPDVYIRPSVIVWNPAAMRNQTTFAHSLKDTSAANRNNETYFRPV
ncbi:hypothetical protein ACI65C_006780 [Semiaphis heraclei]